MRLRDVVVPVLLFALSLSGCGLIFNGRTQQVTLRTNPPGAAAEIDGETVVTPGTVTLSRKREWVVARASKDGYQPACKIVGTSKNKLFTTFDAIPAAIPLLFDLPTAALREFPDEIHLTLEPLEPGVALRRLPPDEDILDLWQPRHIFGSRKNLCNPYDY